MVIELDPANTQLITSVAIGIGLSASAGFRVFVPLLVASVASHYGFMPVNESFSWLSGWPAIIIFFTATMVEILAYYIPFVDNLLDGVTTPLAAIAGTLLMTSVLPFDDNLARWALGIIAGGGAAATVQVGSVITRLMSSKLTAGLGNPVVSTGEHAAAFGTSMLAIILPWLTAACIIMLLVFIIIRYVKRHSVS
jgi:hypothetical protein